MLDQRDDRTIAPGFCWNPERLRFTTIGVVAFHMFHLGHLVQLVAVQVGIPPHRFTDSAPGHVVQLVAVQAVSRPARAHRNWARGGHEAYCHQGPNPRQRRGAPGAGAAPPAQMVLSVGVTGEQVQAAMQKDVFASTSKFKIGFAVHVFCLISIYFGILVIFDP